MARALPAPQTKTTTRGGLRTVHRQDWLWAVLFLGPFLQLDLSSAVAWIIIAAMIALCSGLVSFLREIFVATRHLRIGEP